jgi:hypothetical protein
MIAKPRCKQTGFVVTMEQPNDIQLTLNRQLPSKGFCYQP